MKLIKLIDQYNNEIYVNPQNITHLVKYSTEDTLIYFNTSSEKQAVINVKVNIEKIAELIEQTK